MPASIHGVATDFLALQQTDPFVALVHMRKIVVLRPTDRSSSVFPAVALASAELVARSL